MNKAVFFDRDGILNEVVMRDGVVASPRTPGEFRLTPEAGALVRAAQAAGYLAIVATNQPDLTRGFMKRDDLDLMHRLLMQEAPVDGIEVAESGCNDDPRRKPNPGMLLDAAAKHGVSLPDSWIVGDSIKDIQAGRNAGAGTVLLETPYNSSAHGKADRNFSSPSQILQFIKALSQ
jgi:D-glycero-D-manno-heptose 1,7-bisphosphate phosphatase